MSLAPPFTAETAHLKVKKAQDLWNTQYVPIVSSMPWSCPAYANAHARDPVTIAKAYTEDSIWRNRDTFLQGRDAIVDFLTKKWQKEKEYKLRKELFSFTDNKIAVQFWYEYRDSHDGMKWKRCYGLEDWTFAEDGRMRKRQMSGNDVLLAEGERWYVDGVDVNEVDISEKHW